MKISRKMISTPEQIFDHIANTVCDEFGFTKEELYKGPKFSKELQGGIKIYIDIQEFIYPKKYSVKIDLGFITNINIYEMKDNNILEYTEIIKTKSIMLKIKYYIMELFGKTNRERAIMQLENLDKISKE